MTVACFADFGTLLSRERFALFHPDASLECRGVFMPHAHHTPTARAQTPGEGSGVHEDDTKHPPEGYPPSGTFRPVYGPHSESTWTADRGEPLTAYTVGVYVGCMTVGVAP